MFFETSDFSVEPIFAFEFNWGPHKAASETRPFHALSLRIKGNARFISEEGIVESKSGDIIFAPAYCNYTLEALESEDVCAIHFRTDSVMPDKIKKFSPKTPLVYEKLFKEIVDVYFKKQTGYQHRCRYLLHHIMYCIECDSERIVKEKNFKSISNIGDYIHDNFTDPKLTVSFLEKSLNMSGTYFRKLFKKEFGMPPLVYINKLKLQYAEELLKTGVYTVSEVSDKCGFENVYYFSTFIKRETGISPTEIIKGKRKKPL